MPQHGKPPTAGWMGLRATRSSGRHPCPWKDRWKQMASEVPSNANTLSFSQLLQSPHPQKVLKNHIRGFSSITFEDSSWTATNLWPSQRKILGLQLSASWYISSFSPHATGSKEKKRRWRKETRRLRSTTATDPARKDIFPFSFFLKHKPFQRILNSFQHRRRCLLPPQPQPTQSSSRHPRFSQHASLFHAL